MKRCERPFLPGKKSVDYLISANKDLLRVSIARTKPFLESEMASRRRSFRVQRVNEGCEEEKICRKYMMQKYRLVAKMSIIS
jgi:hypothetical protein